MIPWIIVGHTKTDREEMERGLRSLQSLLRLLVDGDVRTYVNIWNSALLGEYIHSCKGNTGLLSAPTRKRRYLITVTLTIITNFSPLALTLDFLLQLWLCQLLKAQLLPDLLLLGVPHFFSLQTLLTFTACLLS